MRLSIHKRSILCTFIYFFSNHGCLQGLFYVRERRLFALAIFERNNSVRVPFSENYWMGWRNRHTILGNYYLVYRDAKSNLVIFLVIFGGIKSNSWMIFGSKKCYFCVEKLFKLFFELSKVSDFWDEEKSYFKFFMQNQVIFRPIIISALIVAILYKVKKKSKKLLSSQNYNFFQQN